MLLPILARRWGADLIHSLASVGPIRTPGTPHVVTLHDVTFFKASTFSPVTTFGMRQVVSRAARHADAAHLRQRRGARTRSVAELALDPQRFSVVHHGATPVAPGVRQRRARVRERLGLGDRRVVLCVAAKRPHKNQELLVRAAGRLPADVVIVLAGHPEPYDRELRALAAALGVDGEGDLRGLRAAERPRGALGAWRRARRSRRAPRALACR